MTTPATDCPACPSCGLSAGITRDHDDIALPSPHLQCAACGHQWQATAEERAKAERADAAHEEALRRKETR